MQRNERVDYEDHSLLSLIRSDAEANEYSIMLILRIAASIFQLTKELTCFPVLHPELIASGLVWQAVRHGFFDLCDRAGVKFKD